MPRKSKATVSNEHREESVGQRGEATKLGGNKIHGDDLEGVIPTTPMSVERSPQRDRDHDDDGTLK